jgi:hypothetical protein
LAVLVLALLLLVGCDEGTLNEPDVQSDAFRSYVALGNSITAGFQANGINETRQQQSYAVLLAEQMNTPFNIPAIPDPGCPPPVSNIFTGEVPGGEPSACTLREAPVPTTLHNVAVPGAKVVDALSNLVQDASPNTLTSLILGGRTQLRAAREANPSFASVWLGNNDVLGAAISGDVADTTSQALFEAQYTQVLDSLESAGAERGLLVGVADVTFIPHFSAGQVYAALQGEINTFGSIASNGWGQFNVASSCNAGNPGGSSLVPFSYGFGVLFTQALRGETVTLDCAPDSAPESVLVPSEVQVIRETVSGYNATIQRLAEERGWAFVNPNPALGALYAAGTDTPNDPQDDLVPKFPNLRSAQTGAPTFGRYYSEDGVHPSRDLHRGVAYLAIRALNDQYGDEGVDLEQIQIPSELEAVLPSE